MSRLKFTYTYAAFLLLINKLVGLVILSNQSAQFTGTACITGGGGTFEENCVSKYAIFDLNASYEVPNTAATVQLSVNNVFDTAYRSFPGVPHIGRLAMVRVRYQLF